MPAFPRAFKVSLIACSIPGALVVLVATLGAWIQWGGLSFSDPIYYATLAIAAWCPVSKIIAWRLWRRRVDLLCPICIPAKAIERRLSPRVSRAEEIKQLQAEGLRVARVGDRLLEGDDAQHPAANGGHGPMRNKSETSHMHPGETNDAH